MYTPYCCHQICLRNNLLHLVWVIQQFAGCIAVVHNMKVVDDLRKASAPENGGIFVKFLRGGGSFSIKKIHCDFFWL